MLLRASVLSLVTAAAAAAAESSQHAANARWLVHNLSYGILSTSSSVYWQPFNTGVAFGNPQPFVDGTVDEPTGNIYLYVSDDDASMQDVATNAEASFTLSEEFAGNNCSHADVDSKQPLCMRVVLVGSMQNVSEDDRTWASSALFERHPAMKKWTQQGHAFHVLTMKLKTVWMIDSFGGAVTVTPADYFAAKPRSPPPRRQTTVAPSNGKPPVFTDKATTARWMAHHLDFGVLSTSSTSSAYKGVAFGNPHLFADGSMDNSTANLYWYISRKDASMQDIAANPEATFALSDQTLGSYCTTEDADPEDPRCMRCVFIGYMKEVAAAGKPAAKKALFSRHPEMETWPSDQGYKFLTMHIEAVLLIDMLGNTSHVKPTDYSGASLSP